MVTVLFVNTSICETSESQNRNPEYEASTTKHTFNLDCSHGDALPRRSVLSLARYGRAVALRMSPTPQGSSALWALWTATATAPRGPSRGGRDILVGYHDPPPPRVHLAPSTSARRHVRPTARITAWVGSRVTLAATLVTWVASPCPGVAVPPGRRPGPAASVGVQWSLLSLPAGRAAAGRAAVGSHVPLRPLPGRRGPASGTPGHGLWLFYRGYSTSKCVFASAEWLVPPDGRAGRDNGGARVPGPATSDDLSHFQA